MKRTIERELCGFLLRSTLLETKADQGGAVFKLERAGLRGISATALWDFRLTLSAEGFHVCLICTFVKSQKKIRCFA